MIRCTGPCTITLCYLDDEGQEQEEILAETAEPVKLEFLSEPKFPFPRVDLGG